MSWFAVGSAAVGVVGSIYSSNKASKAAKRAGNQAADADAAELAFQQERYDEWKATYGGIEDNLASYYETLSPSLRITQGLEAHEKEMNIARDNLADTFAQRNISMSGVQGQLDTTTSIKSAEERARIRAAAPMEVAKEKLGFLQVGLGQDPSHDMGTTLAGQANDARGNELITARNAGDASGAMIGAITNLGQVGLSAWDKKVNG